MNRFLFFVLGLAVFIPANLNAGWWPLAKKDQGSSGDYEEAWWYRKSEKKSQSVDGDNIDWEKRSLWAPIVERRKSKEHKGSYLIYNDVERDYIRLFPQVWDLNLESSISMGPWLGRTYKDVPYTEQEYVDLRTKMLNKELDVLKKEHIRRKKDAATMGTESEEDVNNLLDNFLDGGKVEENTEEDEEKYLKDFDLQGAGKRILGRMVVPRSRAIETEAVYFQLHDGSIYCVELATGLTVWVIKLSDQLETIPYETTETMHFVTNGYYYMIDKQAGLVQHRSHLDRAIQPTAFATNNSHFLASYRNRVINWNPDRNFPMWVKLMEGQISGGVYGNSEGILVPQENGVMTALGFEGEVKWNFENKGIAEDRLYFEAQLRKVLQQITEEQSKAKIEEREEDKVKVREWELEAREIEVGIDKLSSRIKGRFLSRPITAGDSVYIGNTDFNLYKLNRFTGIPLWKYTCKGKLMEPPTVGNAMVWQRDTTDVLHGVDDKTGILKDTIVGVKKVIFANDDIVFFRNIENRVVVKSSLGYSFIDGLEASLVKISMEKEVLFAYKPGQKTVEVFDLSRMRR